MSGSSPARDFNKIGKHPSEVGNESPPKLFQGMGTRNPVNQRPDREGGKSGNPANQTPDGEGGESNDEKPSSSELFYLTESIDKDSTSSNLESTDPRRSETKGSIVVTDGIKNPQPAKLTLKDMNLRRQDSDTETLSPETVFKKHVVLGKAHVSLYPCKATVSGTIGCQKTPTLKQFLSKAIQTNHGKALDITDNQPTDMDTETCLSCYKIIILSLYPFDKTSWLPSASIQEDAVMCLMSYFASLCKNRFTPGSPCPDWYKLLEFAPVPATSETIDISHPDVADQMKRVFADLKEKWDWLKTDEAVQNVIPTGVCLLSIFDVNSSSAGQDILPHLNKYCTKAVNFACYDHPKDTHELKKEFKDGKAASHYKSKKHQLMRQLCGINKKSVIALTAIHTDHHTHQIEHDEGELNQALQDETSVQNVHHLYMSTGSFVKNKIELEKIVLEASFHETILLRDILLLQMILEKSETFWKKRSDIEKLSEMYDFENGDLECFLKSCTKFGQLFYTHNIPQLKEYVIVDIAGFVNQIHKLYNSRDEELSHFGLFEQRPVDRDYTIMCEFLTALGIALEIEPTQIILEQQPIHPVRTKFHYIPTARNALQETAEGADRLLSLTGYAKETLQAGLCKRLLHSGCRLIPTRTINTTAIRMTCDSIEEDLVLIDNGENIMVNRKDSTDSISPQLKDKLVQILNVEFGDTIERQHFTEALAQK